MELNKKFIDVEGIIAKKSPRLLKWLPRFVLNWIKKKLHEDFINVGMEKYKDKKGHDFNECAIAYMGAEVMSTNPDRIPTKGGLIIVANHPLGGLDGMALIKAVSQKRRDVRFIVNDILLHLKNFGELFVGVNKVGKNAGDTLRSIEEVYSSDNAVLVFPAGLVSRFQNGKILDLDWKKSFVSQAIKHRRMILPVFIEGKNSNFFYSLSRFRKRIGIKANVEMFLLPDEMVNQKGKLIKIHFGTPFSFSNFHSGKSHNEWAQVVKEYIYAMEGNKDLCFEQFLDLKEKHIQSGNSRK